MTAEMPFRASITGIDGAGKDSVSELVADILGKELDVVKVTPPIYGIRDGIESLEFSALIQAYDLVNSAAVRSQNKNAVLLAQAAYVLLQTRVIEPSMIRRYKPDVVIGARDMLVDPAVYANLYAKGTLGSQSINNRIQTMHKITGTPYRQSITLLTAEPRTALEKIKNQMMENTEGGRKRLHYVHETEEHLTYLSQSYRQVLRVLRENHPTPILEVDTNSKMQSESALIVVSHLSMCIRGDVPHNAWLTV